MGTVRKTLNNTYQIDVIDKSGMRIRKHFRYRRDADAVVAKIENEKYEWKLVRNGLHLQRLTLENAIEDSKSEKANLRERSYIKYKNTFYKFKVFVSSKELIYVNEFTREHADEFKNSLNKLGSAPKTVNFYLMTIKAMFNDLVKKDYLAINPFDHIKYEKAKIKSLSQREDEYYDEDELKCFFKQKMEEADWNAFIGLFLTGARVGEFCSLKWENIDFQKRIIMIRSYENFQVKTASSERDVPISDKLLDILTDLKKSESSDYVFTSTNGNKLVERTLLRKVKQIAQKAGIKKNATLHKFRHSFNSHLSQMGVEYSIRQFLLGHAPQSITDHYTKLDASKLSVVVSKLDALIQ